MSDRQATRAETDYAEGLRDPRAEAQRDHGRVSQDHPARQAEGLDPRCSGLAQEVAEHRIAVAPVVVAPRVLVEVALQPPIRDAVVDATNGVLGQGEEAFDRLSVRSPIDVDAV